MSKQAQVQEELVPIISNRVCVSYLHFTDPDPDDHGKNILPPLKRSTLRITPGISFHSPADLARCGVGVTRADGKSLDPLEPTNGELRDTTVDMISEYEARHLARVSNKFELERWQARNRNPKIAEIIGARLAN